MKIKNLHKDYVAKYEHVGDKPLGAGDCGCCWRIKKINDDDGKTYVAKEFYGGETTVKAVF